MMRKLIVLAAMLMSGAATVMAQHDEGDFTVQPKLGLNIASLSDADKSITDLQLGLEAEYMATDRFGLSIGATLSNQGAKYDIFDDANVKSDYKVNLDYVHVPILANFYVLPGLALKAGIQPGFKMRAKAKIDGMSIDLDNLYTLDHLVTGEDVKVSTFDLSIPVGVSYEYRNIVLDARYNWGLLKVMNVGEAFYNRCFMLSLGYKFQVTD